MVIQFKSRCRRSRGPPRLTDLALTGRSGRSGVARGVTSRIAASRCSPTERAHEHQRRPAGAQSPHEVRAPRSDRVDDLTAERERERARSDRGFARADHPAAHVVGRAPLQIPCSATPPIPRRCRRRPSGRPRVATTGRPRSGPSTRPTRTTPQIKRAPPGAPAGTAGRKEPSAAPPPHPAFISP